MEAQNPGPLRPQKAKAVVDFLVKVDTDPATRAAYAADADGAMRAAGLSKAERDLILGGDLEGIRSALGGESRLIVWHPPTVWS
jgi:hypothetical protein